MGSIPTRPRHFHRSPAPARGSRPGVGVGAFAAVLLTICAHVVPLLAQEAEGRAADAWAARVPPADPDSAGRPTSPLGAFARSLVIPGWGQATLGETTRGAFYFAMEAGSLWMVVKTQAKLSAARRAGNEDLAKARANQREDWITMAAFWALFSGVDAWVSAHLWGFEGEVVPPPDGSVGAALRYTLPVGF